MSALTASVDPFIGSDPPGNCLCGPYLPLGVVRLGPDTLDPSTNGYRSDRPIVRFSHTHVSGTGGSGRDGNVGVVPFCGHAHFQPPVYERTDEEAAAGYYAVTLHPGPIRAELTCTRRAGVHRYTFPAGAGANLLVDASAVISHTWDLIPEFERAACIGGFVEWISDRELIGRGDFEGGWGHAFPYSIFFYAWFDRPASRRLVSRDRRGELHPTASTGPRSMAVAAFGDAAEVGLVVGVSHVSVAQARASADREVGRRTFDDVRRAAETAWERRLESVRVEGGTPEQRRMFYTAFTRLLCMPTDLGIDDEQSLWRSGVRHFTDYYAIWDSVRNANSLIALLDPALHADMLTCLLDLGDRIGWLPDAWFAGHSVSQGGSPADILFCEAALKGIDGVDYRHALELMRRNAEAESPDPKRFGRHVADYRDLGYVSTDVPVGCASLHLEYAYQDWCIARLAEHLGDEDVARTYDANARKVWNLWRDDIRSFAPRHPDGRWVDPFDPNHNLPESWFDPYFYEGNARQWSFNVQHDFAELVRRHGGPEGFVRHLDAFFDDGQHRSKETMLHVPYLYLYAGRPDRAADRIRECLERYFQPTRRGLHDNEDMGCQSAFYMCSSIGLYPLMGQDLYWLVPPVFERTELALGDGGASFVIEAQGAGDNGRYITSAALDGERLDRAWLRHEEIARGAVLTLELSPAPNGWGSEHPPPAPG